MLAAASPNCAHRALASLHTENAGNFPAHVTQNVDGFLLLFSSLLQLAINIARRLKQQLRLHDFFSLSISERIPHDTDSVQARASDTILLSTSQSLLESTYSVATAREAPLLGASKEYRYGNR